MRTRGFAAYAAMVLLLLVSCGHEVDRAAWADDLADIGYRDVDIAELEDVYVNEICGDDEDAISMFLAHGADAGDLDMDMQRINFRHACPDEIDKLEAAYDSMQESGDNVDEACALDESDRNESQSRLAEAMGC